MSPDDRTYRTILVDRFDLSGIKTLCFDIGVSYEGLSGETKPMKAMSLIEYLRRRGKTNVLVQWLLDNRPDIKLPAQQTGNVQAGPGGIAVGGSVHGNIIVGN